MAVKLAVAPQKNEGVATLKGTTRQVQKVYAFLPDLNVWQIRAGDVERFVRFAGPGQWREVERPEGA